MAFSMIHKLTRIIKTIVSLGPAHNCAGGKGLVQSEDETLALNLDGNDLGFGRVTKVGDAVGLQAVNATAIAVERGRYAPYGNLMDIRPILSNRFAALGRQETPAHSDGEVDGKSRCPGDVLVRHRGILDRGVVRRYERFPCRVGIFEVCVDDAGGGLMMDGKSSDLTIVHFPVMGLKHATLTR